MSIYGTTFVIGGDPVWEPSPGVVLVRNGGRNDWPNPDTFPSGLLDGAEIPSWCVPGHSECDGPADSIVDGCDGYMTPGGWYRLEALGLQLLLDEDAVRTLRDELTVWLDKPKARPR